jgi:LPXTG-motif cell wall-anchored protein
VTVNAGGGAPSASHTAQTDTQGRFSFTDISTGDYYVYFDGPDGLAVIGESTRGNDHFRLGRGGHTDVFVPAVRWVPAELTVSMTFAKHVYQVGEQVGLNVTLTNTGAGSLSYIRVGCNQIGNSDEIQGNGPGWGPLAPDGAGVNLAPGETRTFAVSESMPPGADLRGYVFASAYDFPLKLDVSPDPRGEAAILLVPGEQPADPGQPQPDPDEPTPPTTTPPTTTAAPVPQGGVGPGTGATGGLPNTGANVEGLTVFGLAVLALGIGGVLVSRRRRTS